MYGGGVRVKTPPGARRALAALLPLGLLIYCWLFFPNVPAARLSTLEVYTVFFLGLCNWMAALLLTDDGGNDRRSRRQRRLHYGLFVLGFVGLVGSKEVNIAPALWLIMAYCAALLLRRNDSWQSALSGIPLAVIFLLVLDTVYDATAAAGVGYGNPLALSEFIDNASAVLSGLFLVETSPIVGIGFALLTAALLIILAVRVAARQFDNRTLFMLFLLGQFASMFAILCASWDVVLRYWYILIPVFAMLLAFAAQILLEVIRDRWRRLLPAAAAAMLGFIIFFVAVNYYNFLLQTTIQHGTRHADAQVIGAVGRLLDHGKYVQANPTDLDLEPVLTLPGYFNGLTRNAGRYGYRVYSAPPTDAVPEYYFVDFYQRDYDYPMAVHQDIVSREDYPILTPAGQLAGALQFRDGAPYHWSDAGAHYPQHYRWAIYRGPTDARAWLEHLLPQAGPPIIRAEWNVHRNGRRLTYIKKEQCSPADTTAMFSLHIIPADVADLRASRQRHGYDNRDFSFDYTGAMGDGVCAAIARLPDYPVIGIRAGQYHPGAGAIWQAPADIDTWAIYDARSYLQRVLEGAGEPIIRSDWNVHHNGRDLTYIKEKCSPADTEAAFILHITPVDAADLPSEQHPYDYDQRDFDFAAGGVSMDGVCVILARLPDYPIAGIRTGQHIPGAPPLWAAQASVAAWQAPTYAYLQNLLDRAGEPIIRAEWTVHHTGRRLIYRKEQCSPEDADADTTAPFLLHIIPANAADLPAERQRYGYDNRDFGFAPDGIRADGVTADGVCAILVQLPDYPIAGIRTGQYIPGAPPLWAVEIGLDE